MSRGEVITCLNPQRIRWCCDQVGTDLAELAKRTGIPESKLENATLTKRQLKTVAKHFGHSLFFFAEEEQATEKMHSAQFRELGKQAELDDNLYKIIRQVEWHRDLLIDLLMDGGEELSFQPPDLHGDLVNKASIVRRWLKIEDKEQYEYENYRSLVESKGFFVLRSMGYLGNWRVKNPDNMLGFSIQHSQLPAIFITKTSPARQTFTLFHELGHLLLHQDSCLDQAINFRSDHSTKREVEANEFARHCLLSDDILDDLQIPEHYEEYAQAFKTISNRRGISVEVVVVALLKTGRINRANYEEYKAYKKKQEERKSFTSTQKPIVPRNYRYREPLHIFGSRYVNAVLDGMQQGEITLNKASNYLDGLKIQDIDRLLYGESEAA